MPTSTTLRKPPSRRFSQAEALRLWRSYRATDDPRLRDRLIMTCAPLVKHIVYRKIREVPSHQEADDYISRGLEALITSIDRYDPARGATLEQFLWTRIHGAVPDELRRQDWAPRSVRRFDREVAKAARSFRAIHGREPADEELVDALAVSVDELRALAPTSSVPTSARSTPPPPTGRLRGSSASRRCTRATSAAGPSKPR